MYAMSCDDADEGISKYETMSVAELRREYSRITGDAKELQRYVDGATKKYATLERDGSVDLPKLEGFIEMAEELILDLAEQNGASGSVTSIGRVADIEFDIATTAMEYTLDLERFHKRVKLLFKWHAKHSDVTRNQYMAPYFPLVQSSGMGKTKLLYELRKRYEQESQSKSGWQLQLKQPPTETEPEMETVCKLVLCTPSNAPKSLTINSIYTSMLHVPQSRQQEDAEKIRADLNLLIKDNDDGNKKKRYVLLFDEAQHLLQTDIDGWAFRVVRWWLRVERNESVVAVFAGTTSKLANFYREPPPQSTTSRDANQQYLGAGNELYEPFFEICTIGLLAATAASDPDAVADDTTEYRNAIPFGRPLFARLQTKSALTKEVEQSILSRMTLSKSLWESSKEACLSILATRAQMGQVPFDLASELVSMGYASLTHCSRNDGKVADVCFFPKPVCARLSMSLMIEKHEHGAFIGKSPAFWMDQASTNFSQGLCRPQKGDLGEVAAAFYLLFCGDRLRHKRDTKLETFSVPLAQWVSLLLDPASEPNVAVSDSMSDVTYLGPSVSFIQVCRSYLRLPLADLVPLLSSWYKAGRALYQFPSCPAYDIIAPIQYESSTGESKYCPLLVSVKNALAYSKGEQKSACDAMEQVMEDAGIKVGVCLLLLFLGGQGEKADTDELIKPRRNATDQIEQLIKLESSGIVTIVVVVPKNDPFGVSTFVDATSTGGGHLAEVYVSHAEVQLTTSDTNKMLRKETDRDASTFLKELQNAFRLAAATPEPVVEQSDGQRKRSESE